AAAYRHHLLHEAVPARSVRYSNNALSALDDFFVRLGLGRAEVARDDPPASEPRVLTGQARAAWLSTVEACPHPRDRLLALLPLHTGLRIGEIVALDLPVCLAEVLREPLDRWLAERRNWPNAGTEPALFLNRRGGRLSVRAAGAVFAALGTGEVTATTGRNTFHSALRTASASASAPASAPASASASAPTPAPGRRVPGKDGFRGGQEQRRERIVDAAMRLMVAVDYEKIQVRDVADEAGVALGTLYRYFGSKDHVFACALTKWSSGFGGRIQHRDEATVLERVRTVYGRAARAFEGEPRVYEVLAQLEGSRDERAAEVYQEFVRVQNQAFAAALPDLPAAERADIVWLMGAVLAEGLRSRMLGLLDMPGVYYKISRAAELMLD
ncbi:MAG: TetR family transcriptional regulator, partial [Streptosporangiaceae bacterium]